jgi:NAD+ synthase (glutamine-hydrolysing)
MKRLMHTGSQKVVLGISGGLDSTLALLVTVKAFDRLNWSRDDIVAVTMPGFGTTSRTKGNAEALAVELGVTLRTISIDAAVRQHFADIGQDPEKHDITYENSQARERTQILMDLANQVGGLVVGTGDLSELALGWTTYNGDHMSMYGVNASVPKTLVRYLIEWCAEAEFSGKAAETLHDVCATPVSPELLPPNEDGDISQKTEEHVGPYELHDFFLFHVVRNQFAPRKILDLARRAFVGDYSKAEILKWLKLFYQRFFAQQFKRSCLPDGPKVGSVSLSPRGDWRMPSDASAALWLAELDQVTGKDS